MREAGVEVEDFTASLCGWRLMLKDGRYWNDRDKRTYTDWQNGTEFPTESAARIAWAQAELARQKEDFPTNRFLDPTTKAMLRERIARLEAAIVAEQHDAGMEAMGFERREVEAEKGEQPDAELPKYSISISEDGREIIDFPNGEYGYGDTSVCGQLNRLAACIADLEAERDGALNAAKYWKANHDEQVKRNRVLRDRPDLPAERVRSYQVIVDENDRLRRELAEAKESSPVELLFFTADWAQPCRVLALTIDRIEQDQLCRVRRVDVDTEKDFAAKHEIAAVPVVIIQGQGVPRRYVGITPEKTLREAIKSLAPKEPRDDA